MGDPGSRYRLERLISLKEASEQRLAAALAAALEECRTMERRRDEAAAALAQAQTELDRRRQRFRQTLGGAEGLTGAQLGRVHRFEGRLQRVIEQRRRRLDRANADLVPVQDGVTRARQAHGRARADLKAVRRGQQRFVAQRRVRREQSREQELEALVVAAAAKRRDA